MNNEQFWRIIGCYVDFPNADRQLHAIAVSLERLKDAELIEFSRLVAIHLSACNSWDLCNAFVLMNDEYISDDLFQDFCAGLILQGKKIYEAVLSDTEYLVNVPIFEPAENLPYLPQREYEKRHPGKDMQHFKIDLYPGVPNPIQSAAALKRKFPLLARRYSQKT